MFDIKLITLLCLMAENLPVVVTDLCLCSVPFTSVVCSVSWILKSWQISVCCEVIKGQFNYICFIKNASPD